MNFSEQPPSKEWAALKLRGETLAEVWLKPEGEPLALLFRIPQNSFQIPGMGQRLTAENLLKAVAIATEDVESWRQGGVSDGGEGEMGRGGEGATKRDQLSPPRPLPGSPPLLLEN